MASQDYNYVLYYNKFSICSLMVRLSYAYRGEARDTKDEIVIKEEHIDTGKKEQLTEHFLCNVNAYGEVPVLVPVNGKSIPDSVAITHYLAKFYPSLIPEEHATQIEKYLKALHQINFFSLSFWVMNAAPVENVKLLQARLDEDISESYRAAIRTKIERVQRQKVNGTADEEVKRNVERTKALMSELRAMLRDSSTEWFFGLDRPSALDTHLLIFVARLQDVARGELVPGDLVKWADNFMQRKEWKSLMGEGGRTMPPPMLAQAKAKLSNGA